jgi:hypothetical protein
MGCSSRFVKDLHPYTGPEFGDGTCGGRDSTAVGGRCRLRRDVSPEYGAEMICPECRAEYREGFRRCADCGVELVEVLPGALVADERNGAEAAGGEHQEDPFCEFWRGDDLRLQGELCQVLGEAGIPYRTLQLNDVLRMLGIPARQAAFRIGVPFSMFDRAERAVADAFGDALEEAAFGRFLTTGESE